MKRRFRLRAFLAMTSALLAGCSTVTVDRSFDRVQEALADRTRSSPEWPTSDEARDRIDTRVAELLTLPLDCERAVEIALIHNRDLRAEYSRLGFAEADLVEAGLLENPGFDASIGFPDRAPSLARLDFGVTLNILQWLMTPLRRKIASDRLDAEVVEVAHAVLQTATETRIAFLDLQAAMNMSAVLREIAIASEASFEFAQRVYDAGNLSELALANEQALCEQSRLEHARSLADVAERREILNTQLGLWGTQTRWSIEERLPELPAREPDLAELESLAMRHRLDLAASAKEVEAISRAAGLQRDWRYLLSMAVGGNAERDTDGQWVVGPTLSAEVPIFDRRQGQIARLDAALLAAEARLEGLAIRVRSDVRRLRDRLFACRYEAEHYRDVIVPLRERINALTQEQYNFMLADTFDLLAGKRESIAAYQEYLDSIKRYWMTRIRLEEAVGGRLTTEASSVGPKPSQPDASLDESPTRGESDASAVHDHGGH